MLEDEPLGMCCRVLSYFWTESESVLEPFDKEAFLRSRPSDTFSASDPDIDPEAYCSSQAQSILTSRQEHHFYVDTKTNRSTWIHPYDDPEYLRSLPDTHPAHPESREAKAIRQHEEAERAMRAKKTGQAGDVAGGEKRNWFQKKKDNLIGTKEERVKEKAERKKREAEEERAYVVSGCVSQHAVELSGFQTWLSGRWLMNRPPSRHT